MAQHSVSVSQLNSPYPGKSYLNVVDNTSGRIAVWGSAHNVPVYFCQRGHFFELIAFDNEDYAQEWFENNHESYTSVYRVQG
jgi:hypothetical protein